MSFKHEIQWTSSCLQCPRTHLTSNSTNKKIFCGYSKASWKSKYHIKRKFNEFTPHIKPRPCHLVCVFVCVWLYAPSWTQIRLCMGLIAFANWFSWTCTAIFNFQCHSLERSWPLSFLCNSYSSVLTTIIIYFWLSGTPFSMMIKHFKFIM